MRENDRRNTLFHILANRTFRHLFAAQVVALAGTGLATIALALLAFNLSGAEAGRVLGTALAIKMIAYVAISPVASAFVSVLPRRQTLVAIDLWRAAIVCLLPFVTEIWQIYLLIFLLQAGSAAFTPAFQATIPDVLPDEEDYTKALSMSRLAYDLESLVSPMLAALLLGIVASNTLFFGTAAGFVLSAALIVTVALPRTKCGKSRKVFDRTTRGIKIYIATPRLRGLLAVNMAVAAAGALVFVNTVVYVREAFALGEPHTAIAFAAFGFGSMLLALSLPHILKLKSDRFVMLPAAFLLGVAALAAAFIDGFASLLILWFAIGCAYAAALVPSGRLLRRSAYAEDRPALFAAQFALSHACWLITYPLAGWLGSAIGLPTAAIMLGIAALAAAFAAVLLWPAGDTGELEHDHDNLPPDHPHMTEGHDRHGRKHSHDFIIDDLHPHWPGKQG